MLNQLQEKLSNQMNKLSPLLNILKGIAIGMANIIPGVSGGTIAVITGIYDDLVNAFGNFFSGPGGWRKNMLLLIPVLIGVLIGNIAFARLIGYLLQTAPVATRYGFMGLILGSLPYIMKHSALKAFKLRYLVLALLGLVIVIGMGLMPEPEKSLPITELTLQSAALLFGAAFLASIAMVIPGISGSFLLLLMGMYSAMQNAFSTLNTPIMFLFVSGTILGVVCVSKTISALLRRFHTATYSVITGLVVGSALILFPGFSSGKHLLIDVFSFAIGLCLSLFLGTNTKEHILCTQKDK